MGITAGRLLGISEQEFNLREAWVKLLGLHRGANDIEDYARELITTPFDGAYGQAGVVITINGSPPKAAAFVMTHRQDWGGSAVYVIRQDTHFIKIIDPVARRRNAGKARVEFFNAVMAYLKYKGLID